MINTVSCDIVTRIGKGCLSGMPSPQSIRLCEKQGHKEYQGLDLAYDFFFGFLTLARFTSGNNPNPRTKREAQHVFENAFIQAKVLFFPRTWYFPS